MTEDPNVEAVRARRRQTNALIAARQAQRLRPFFTVDACVIVGDGALITGADAVIAAFDAQFRDPTFITYVREPERVEIAEGDERAAESGRWVGRWRDGSEMGGAYLAAWRRVRGQWAIERELFVTLKG